MAGLFNWRVQGNLLEVSVFPPEEDGFTRGIPATRRRPGARTRKRAKEALWKHVKVVVVWIDRRLLLLEDRVTRTDDSEWIQGFKALGQNAPNAEIGLLLVAARRGDCFPADALTAFLEEATCLKKLGVHGVPLGGNIRGLQQHILSRGQNFSSSQPLEALCHDVAATKYSSPEAATKVASTLVALKSIKRLHLEGLIFANTTSSVQALSNLCQRPNLESLSLDLVLDPEILKLASNVVTSSRNLIQLRVGFHPPPSSTTLGGDAAFPEFAQALSESNIIIVELRIHSSFLLASSVIATSLKKVLTYNYSCRCFKMQLVDGLTTDDSSSEPQQQDPILEPMNTHIQTFVRLNNQKRTRLLSHFIPETAGYCSWMDLMEDLASTPDDDNNDAPQRRQPDQPLAAADILTGTFLFLRQHAGRVASIAMGKYHADGHGGNVIYQGQRGEQAWSGHVERVQRHVQNYKGAVRSLFGAEKILAGIFIYTAERERDSFHLSKYSAEVKQKFANLNRIMSISRGVDLLARMNLQTSNHWVDSAAKKLDCAREYARICQMRDDVEELLQDIGMNN